MFQTQLEIDKALQEDPSVYEYDNIYDNIQAEKVNTNVKEAHKKDKKVDDKRLFYTCIHTVMAG